ncbi:HrpJ domain-containing protein [Aureimonas sp. AU4]|uniref:HrpJ domain-containing protein n=1 Tax=Aureimonas sp. AU4 TaxID=1638163 RepID=UPI00078350B3|nr:HrpJ domain-containing protein [Aureimonas sp. AU4]
MAGAIETTRQNVAALSATSPVGAEVMRAVQGNYRGETVETSSEASKLEDAKEEIGMAVAHRADKKTLGQRQVRQGQGANLQAIARIADYYDKLPDMPRESELQGLVEDLTRMQELLQGGGGGGGGSATAEDVLRLLQRFDPDSTHQFAALEIARDFFAASGGDEAFQALLDQAHAAYGRGDLGRDVRAGFASAEVAARASATMETDPALFRDAYRQMARETPDMGRLFDAFRAFDPLKNFDEIVAAFMETAGRDLAATGPSADPVHLHGLLTELGKLKKMSTTLEMAEDLARTTNRLLRPDDQPTDYSKVKCPACRARESRQEVLKTPSVCRTCRSGAALDIAGLMLSYASRQSAGSGDARQLLHPYAQCSLATQVAFANGLHDMHRQLSDEIMPSPQARLQQSAALSALNEELVNAEEAAWQAEAQRGVA